MVPYLFALDSVGHFGLTVYVDTHVGLFPLPSPTQSSGSQECLLLSLKSIPFSLLLTVLLHSSSSSCFCLFVNLCMVAVLTLKYQ